MIQQTTWAAGARRAVRGRAVSAAGATLLACVLTAPLFAGAGAAADERAGDGKGKDEGSDPIDFAIVVDQSASLSKEDLAREVRAAALISQGEISERSRAMVIGFGSAEKKGQSATRQVCELTELSAAGRQDLSRCVKDDLASPDRREIGPGTDFPAALQQATTRLAGAGRPATPKVVFLLTDGKLDVKDSPNYGRGGDRGSRQKSGEEKLREELRRAREEKIQIWPMGFGGRDAIDARALRAMAEGGYRNGCAQLPDATPRMRVVEEPAKLERTLQETFAKARCAAVVQGASGKPPTDLHVSIPPIATDGSITVTKRDPEVRATYFDPRGNEVPTAGAKYGSHFELSGQNGPVEALRVKNPMPGKWRVRLDASPDHRGQEASVSAIWQGRLGSVLTMRPASPRPGEKVLVEAWLQTRDRVTVDDTDQLDGVRATVRLEGDGFAPVRGVRLRDDGEQGDKRAGDVRFTGKVTIPESAGGDLRVTSEMAAPGVSGDERPYDTAITPGARTLRATATVDHHSVHPGGTAEGTLVADNAGKSARTLRLRLEDQAAGRVRISPATVRVPAGASKSVRYTLHFARGVPLGEAGGRIVVTDTTDGDRRISDTALEVTVEAPPTWWDTWWQEVVAGGAVALLIVSLLVVRSWAKRGIRDLSGLELELHKDGRLASRIKVRGGRGRQRGFDFTVDAHGTRAELHVSRNGAGRQYRLTREPSGALKVRTPQGRDLTMRPGEQTALGDELGLLVRGRGSAGTARTTRGGGGSGGASRGGGSAGRKHPRKRTARVPGQREGTEPASGRPTDGESESAPAEARHSSSQYDPNF